MSDESLSKDREHMALLQRSRRQRLTRIDYMPSCVALAVIDAKRATVQTGSSAATNSALLNAILTEWSKLTGIGSSEVPPAANPDDRPELRHQDAPARMTFDAERSARAQDFGGTSGITARIAGARAGAYESDGRALHDGDLGKGREKARESCGAKRHRDGKPCQALSEPGKRRCRFHGGRSTGPRTPEGKAKAQANLKQGKSSYRP